MGNRAAIQASRHTTTIAEVLGISRNDADLIAARRLLDQIRESLETITCDLISTRRALGGLPGAISELAAELLDDTGDSPPHAHTPEWEAPRTAYLLTAAVADGDNAEAEALWKLLDKSGQADLLLALAAQLKVNLLTALSATGTDTGRYVMARALAEVNADVSAVRGIQNDVFAQMCRNIARQPVLPGTPVDPRQHPPSDNVNASFFGA